MSAVTVAVHSKPIHGFSKTSQSSVEVAEGGSAPRPLRRKLQESKVMRSSSRYFYSSASKIRVARFSGAGFRLASIGNNGGQTLIKFNLAPSLWR